MISVSSVSSVSSVANKDPGAFRVECYEEPKCRLMTKLLPDIDCLLIKMYNINSIYSMQLCTGYNAVKGCIYMSRNIFDKEKKAYIISSENKNTLLNNLTITLQENRVITFAYIHGSFFTEDTFRDIDIAVYMDEQATRDKASYTRREIALEMEIEKMFNYPFDIRILNNAPLSFRYNVLKNGKLLFSKNEDLSANFAARTMSDYIDFLPYRKRYLKEVLNLEI
ncbi:MAG TPA: hypothetical protein DEF36_04500 [Desulfotomaculum sp.]|nr:hypothetical protein [Desulfotomaculum sp.]